MYYNKNLPFISGIFILIIVFSYFMHKKINNMKLSKLEKYVIFMNTPEYFNVKVLKDKKLQEQFYAKHKDNTHTKLMNLKKQSCKNPLHKTYRDCIHYMWEAKKTKDTSCVLSHLHLLTVKLRHNIDFKTLEGNHKGHEYFKEFEKLLIDNLEYVCSVAPIRYIQSFLTNYTHYSKDSIEKLLSHHIQLIINYEMLSSYKKCGLETTNKNIIIDQYHDTINFENPIDIWRNINVRDIIPSLRMYPILYELYVYVIKSVLLQENTIAHQINVNESNLRYIINKVINPLQL